MTEMTESTTTLKPNAEGRFTWQTDEISMGFLAGADGPVRLAALAGRGMTPVDDETTAQRDPRPIVEVVSPRGGSSDNRQRFVLSAVGAKLRFVTATATRNDGVSRLEIMQHDPSADLLVTSVFEAFEGVSAVRGWTVLSSAEGFPVEAVSSISLTMPMDANGADVEHTSLFWGNSAWAVENDWHRCLLREANLRDRNTRINPGEPASRFLLSSNSTWSTGIYQPAGILEAAGADCQPAFSLMWQIEHNGAWTWEVGENEPCVHISCSGPEFEDHQWFTSLGEGLDFTSVPVSFAVVAGDWQNAVGEMTRQRRALRHAKAIELGRTREFEHSQGLVVYNDFMNTLFGDPRLAKELPLIEGASKVGADVFCIDAGWYDSTDGGWWDMVGEWEPSTNRFGDMGLKGVAEYVRQHGMGLGLWLEPEVIGVNSAMAVKLPESAFIRRHGERVAHSGRYLLDFRSPEARDHVTRTVDRLISEFGTVFFKFDYNTIPGAGPDERCESIGQGLLEHCRAYLDWLDELRRRHPDVMIENCGSGAMRADYAQLARLDLQSTSDQCDPLVYAALAAGAGMTIPPEQQGNWGYAQQDMDDETAVLTLAAGVTGRLYLSGFIDRMDSMRLALVQDAVALHRRILATQEHMLPYWPLGLPDFAGAWLASGLLPDAIGPTDDVPGYITVWRRGGSASAELSVPTGRDLVQVFPDSAHAPNAQPWKVTRIDNGTVRVTASTTAEPSARIFRVQ